MVTLKTDIETLTRITTEESESQPYNTDLIE